MLAINRQPIHKNKLLLSSVALLAGFVLTVGIIRAVNPATNGEQSVRTPHRTSNLLPISSSSSESGAESGDKAKNPSTAGEGSAEASNQQSAPASTSKPANPGSSTAASSAPAASSQSSSSPNTPTTSTSQPSSPAPVAQPPAAQPVKQCHIVNLLGLVCI